ncbi:MAG: hypothetical protein ABH864_05070 [archaeon]
MGCRWLFLLGGVFLICVVFGGFVSAYTLTDNVGVDEIVCQSYEDSMDIRSVDFEYVGDHMDVVITVKGDGSGEIPLPGSSHFAYTVRFSQTEQARINLRTSGSVDCFNDCQSPSVSGNTLRFNWNQAPPSSSRTVSGSVVYWGGDGVCRTGDTVSGTLPAEGSSPPECGDGNVDDGEGCDGSNLNGETCQTQGFDSGSLSCDSSCNIITSGCSNEGGGSSEEMNAVSLYLTPASSAPAVIGQPYGVDVIVKSEGQDPFVMVNLILLWDPTKATLNTEIDLSNADYTDWMISEFIPGFPINDNLVDGDAEFNLLAGYPGAPVATSEGINVGRFWLTPLTSDFNFNVKKSYTAREGGADYYTTAVYDDEYGGWDILPYYDIHGGVGELFMPDLTQPYCGNGIVDEGEECDGYDGIGYCVDLGYSGGIYGCTTDCIVDVTGCDGAEPSGLCGNGVVDEGEACDGTDLRGMTCEFVGGGDAEGVLGCLADCSNFDVSGCY